MESPDIPGRFVLHTNVLPNRIGFEGDPEAKPGSTRVSTKWPFQRFWWTDHAADQGDIVSYRVIPMMEPAEKPVKREDLASEWSSGGTARIASY